MTTQQITLPDRLAQQAQHADQLFSAMDRMSCVDQPAIMSSEAVAEEIAAMRSESRAHKAADES